MVALTLGGSLPSEGFSASIGQQNLGPQRHGSTGERSNFQVDLLIAKRYIYDEGVVQSFYPEQPFNAKPRMERVMTQA